MQLNEIWFLIVGVLFIGYFILDGFDFGVGIALPFMSKDDLDKRVLINTIGPVWDMNETWVLVAGACLFAAFPDWYASLFSGFYLALLLILLALIARGVSFEYRGKRESAKWRNTFDWMIFVGSAVPALLWGVAFANIIQGVPLDENHNYTGTLFTLLNPYGLLGGLVTLSLFFTYGLVFIALKTEGEIRVRARALTTKVGAGSVLLAAAFLVWTLISHFTWFGGVLSLVAAISLVSALVANHFAREGISFSLLALTIATAVGSLFTALFPNVLPSTTNPDFSLTIANASSSEYTLTVMTWVILFSLPLVLVYQGWTYWVFKRRVSRKSIPAGSH